jgi:CubicO group peptidase (beta-lactamase class C family)
MKTISNSILEGFIKINAEQDLRVRQIHVYIEGYRPIYHEFMRSHRENLFSASKVYTSIAIGMAIDEGRFDIDDYVIDLFPHFKPIADNKVKKVTVKNLLQMNSGKEGLFFHKHPYKSYVDYAEVFFRESVQHDPGTGFCYNNLNSYMLSRIIEQVSGQKLRDYLENRLFKKFGYFNTQWETCPNGHTMGLDGLHLRTDEFAQVGQLLLQQGRWNEEQLISETYVQKMSQDLISTAKEESELETQQGYGYQVWKGVYEDSFRADGLNGQFCIIYPNKKSVVTVTARQEWNPYKIISTINEQIIERI